jgi:phosphoglycolate phosphatase
MVRGMEPKPGEGYVVSVCRAVIFDMDGTLLNSLQDLADSMNRVLRQAGYPDHPLDAYRYYVGDGVEELARRALPEPNRDVQTVARIKRAMQEEYAHHWADRTGPYPGITALLQTLSERRVPMAILSNKPDLFTRQMGEHFFRRWHFDAILGASDSTPRKPDPEGALAICRQWACRSEEVLYAGDTGTDMLTARRAGMFAVGVLWGFRDRRELLENGAQALVRKPRELLRFLADTEAPRRPERG